MGEGLISCGRNPQLCTISFSKDRVLYGSYNRGYSPVMTVISHQQRRIATGQTGAESREIPETTKGDTAMTYTNMTNEELVERISAGEEAAIGVDHFEKLINEFDVLEQ